MKVKYLVFLHANSRGRRWTAEQQHQQQRRLQQQRPFVIE